MKSLLAAFLISLGLAGCATTSGTAPKVSSSGFDGSKRVSIEGHGVACDQMVCPLIGAMWSSNTPVSYTHLRAHETHYTISV
ncbi:hypothetical protein ACN6QN_15585, partial [Acinetobacter baumannii]